MKRIIAVFLCLLTFTACLCGCNKTEKVKESYLDGVASIKIKSQYSKGRAPYIYSLDFYGRTISLTMPKDKEGTEKEMTDEDKSALFDMFEKCDIEHWKNEYIDFQVVDGHEWEIDIVMKDGTERHIEGSNGYPVEWDLLRKDIRNFSGVDILLESSAYSPERIKTIDFFHSTEGWCYHTGIIHMGEGYAYLDVDDNSTVYYFDEGDKEKLIDALFKAKITEWNKDYSNNSVKDGDQWQILITYPGDRTRYIEGSNAYPDGWDELRQSIIGIMGIDVVGDRIHFDKE